MLTALNLKKELKAKASLRKAEVLLRFFKTGPGEYGEGDVFLGVTVPQTRKCAKKYLGLGLKEVLELLCSKIHEERLAALLILVGKFQSGSEQEKKAIFNLYLKNSRYVNNWDLVDLSADKIVGAYLLKRPKTILFKLIKSKNVWERRIAVMATFCFIKNNYFETTLKIIKKLLGDKHDLIQKAAGWMLREIGKRDFKVEDKFLKSHYKKMPRTMLRYAIERFPESKRREYLRKIG